MVFLTIIWKNLNAVVNCSFLVYDKVLGGGGGGGGGEGRGGGWDKRSLRNRS